MADKKTLGSAIDDIITALEELDAKARITAISAACAHLGLNPQIGGAPQTSGPSEGQTGSGGIPPPGSVAQQDVQITDIRSLKNEKSPRTAKEMACLVAYYLQNLAPETERKDTVTAADIEKYFKQAGFRLPKRIEQLLVDAKGSGYFDSAGRGSYRLNPVGYNLVAHSLPRQQSGN